MELKEIASISGKEGLFRVLKPSRTGVIVETLDAQKKKMAVGSAGKVSILKEISIYTNTKDGSVPLQEVLTTIFEKYQDKLPVDSKASTADLMQFLQGVLPEFDVDKVYPSDVKKLVKWYNILFKEAPEVLQRQEEVKAEPAKEDKKTTKAKKETATETQEESKATKKASTKKKEETAEVKEETKTTAKKATTKKKVDETVEAKEEKPKKTTAKAKKETEAKEVEEKPKKSSKKKEA
ncbi:MAG: DUF5606 domain-containing protein [Raineya sp.]|jgi:hypothetical protein|nr:DUF5606 domain-containing protein [Raineya sp.]